MYKVKEIYRSLQGEGFHTGRPAIFLRFTGCNLWTGREQDRLNAICQFCDTDFVGMDDPNGGKYDAEALALIVAKLWNGNSGEPFVVCTGGEPLLQLDEMLISSLHKKGFAVAVETNGTIEAPENIDWICMSPKANTDIVQRNGNEIKIVFPQEGIDPKAFEGLVFQHYYLQPMDSEMQEENTRACVDYCLSNPKWKLSLQTHKLIGLP